MADVLIVAYLLIVVALVIVILLQRSEGGGLGMGGGGSGGFMTVRGTANMLTRATGILAAMFFAIALGLTLLNGADKTTTSILDNAAKPVAPASGTTTTAPGNKPAAQPTLLDQLNAAQAQQSGTATPAAPASTPATTPSAPPAAPSGGQDAPDVALPAPAPAAPADSATTTAPAAGSGSAPASPAPATN